MNMYFADVIGQEWNCLYPHKQEITDDASLAKAVRQPYARVERADDRPIKLRLGDWARQPETHDRKSIADQGSVR